jgi:hypothetical protein
VSQLELFSGPHVPMARCLAALETGDVRGAREALGGVESADRDRLAALETRLAASMPAGDVHAAFEAALAPPSGEIPSATWFRCYARVIAASLDALPGGRFRGWPAAHFRLAAGDAPAALLSAQRLVMACREGWAGLEAARVAWAAGAPGRAGRWLVVACLADDDRLGPAPPWLLAADAAALNPAAGVLPRLPAPVEDLWGEVEALDLPGRPSAWVPAVGIIDGVFSPSLLGWSADLRDSGFDPAAAPPTGEPPSRAFLRALLQARAARAAASGASAGVGEAELAARRAMKRLAPRLLARYLARLGP